MIGILHSGDLGKVSTGGISEYVRQFIETIDEPVRLFGTDLYEANKTVKSPSVLSRRVNDSRFYEFVRICTNKRRPITLYYLVHIMWLMITLPNLFRSIDVFYSQRMEFVLPFLFLYRKKKVIFAVHGSSAYSVAFWGRLKAEIYLFLERVAVSRADKIFVLNSNPNYGMEYYQERYRRYREKFEYVRVPVDNRIFRPVPRNETRVEHQLPLNIPLLVYMGRLEHSPKRVLLLPDILMNVKQSLPDTGMLIIGDGMDKQRLLGKFEELGLSDSLFLFPYIGERAKLASLLGAANVSIIISSFEGICMSALESLSAGVPVVATDVGEIAQYVVPGVNGDIIANSIDESDVVNDASLAIIQLLISGTTKGKPVSGYEIEQVFQTTLSKLYD